MAKLSEFWRALLSGGWTKEGAVEQGIHGYIPWENSRFWRQLELLIEYWRSPWKPDLRHRTGQLELLWEKTSRPGRRKSAEKRWLGYVRIREIPQTFQFGEVSELVRWEWDVQKIWRNMGGAGCFWWEDILQLTRRSGLWEKRIENPETSNAKHRFPVYPSTMYSLFSYQNIKHFHLVRGFSIAMFDNTGG